MNEQTELSTALVKNEAQPLDVRRDPTPAEMLSAFLERGVTSENVAAVKELVGLTIQMDDRKNKQTYAQSFKALQDEMPHVKATKIIPDNSGNVRSTFAPFEEIMAQVQPLLAKHGFTLGFDTDYGDGRIIAHCILGHVSGHEERRKFAVRLSAPPKCSDAQADGATLAYAKRGALCATLNIVIDHDVDARNQGGGITPGQVASLRERIAATKSDERRMLRIAGVAALEDISTDKYEVLDNLLSEKERAQARVNP